MKKTATLNVRINPETKRDAEEVLSRLGLSLSTAIEMFLKQVSYQKKIPFELSLPVIDRNESDYPKNS